MRRGKDTEAIGVDDSVRGSGMGSELGGVKLNPCGVEVGLGPRGERRSTRTMEVAHC